MVCPIHGEPTEFFGGNEPDEDWRPNLERLERLMKQVEEETALHAPLPRVEGVSVIEDNGRLFVSQTALQRAGLRLSRMMPDQFYLFALDDGFVYETQGWDNPRRRWWVERVAPEVTSAR
jgi:hypothetical protein